jgi:hypothetical protein
MFNLRWRMNGFRRPVLKVAAGEVVGRNWLPSGATQELANRSAVSSAAALDQMLEIRASTWNKRTLKA